MRVDGRMRMGKEETEGRRMRHEEGVSCKRDPGGGKMGK